MADIPGRRSQKACRNRRNHDAARHGKEYYFGPAAAPMRESPSPAKGVRFRSLSLRSSWVQIPSPAPFRLAGQMCPDTPHRLYHQTNTARADSLAPPCERPGNCRAPCTEPAGGRWDAFTIRPFQIRRAGQMSAAAHAIVPVLHGPAPFQRNCRDVRIRRRHRAALAITRPSATRGHIPSS